MIDIMGNRRNITGLRLIIQEMKNARYVALYMVNVFSDKIGLLMIQAKCQGPIWIGMNKNLYLLELYPGVAKFGVA